MPSTSQEPSSRRTTRWVGVARLGDVADQRLQDVVQGHQPFEVAVFVDDQRHRLARAS